MTEKLFFRPPIVNSSNVRSRDNLIGVQEMIHMVSESGAIGMYIRMHHEIWEYPIKGIAIENLFVNVFSKVLGLGEIVDGTLFGWRPESHRPGADLTIPSFLTSKIGFKTGQISKIGRKKRDPDILQDHRIVFSSHRLTAHENWIDKLNFISHPHCDITFLLSPHIEYGKYYWVVMENFDFKKMEWSESHSKKSGNHVGWVGTDEDQGVIKAKVSKVLSAQLWIEARLSSSRILHFEEICLD